MNYRVKNISQPHGADASGAVIFSDNFTPPPVKKSILTGEAEGKVILVGDALAAPPEELYVFGETSQNGEPTPESPLELISAGSVMTTGAQLLNSDEMVIGGLSGNTGNEFNATNRIRVGFVPVESRKYYKLSGYDGYKVANAHVYDSSKTRIGGYEDKLPIPDQGAYVRFSFGHTDDTDFTEDELSVLKKSLMFNEGETALPYEPYTGGKPAVNPEAGEIGVEVYGGNLFPDFIEDKIYSKGSSVKVNSDGSITVHKVEGDIISIRTTMFLKKGAYTLSNGIESGNPVYFQVFGYATFSRGTVSFRLNEDEEGFVYLYSDSQTVSDVTIRPMLNVSTEPLPYEPYKQPQTVTFNTPGGLPGIPVNSNGNYTDANNQQWVCDSIEYHRGKLSYVQRVKWIEFDGSADEVWREYVGYEGFYVVVDDLKIGNRLSGFCDKFDVIVNGSGINRKGIWIAVDSNIMYFIRMREYASTIEEWKTWLSKNPIKVLYQLETPVETEITDSEILNQFKSTLLNSPNTTIMNDANASMKLKYYLKETFTMANVNFRFGTYEQYKAVASKDTNTLYFADGVIYKGDAPYSQKVEMVSAFPETTNAAQGVLYVNSSTYEARFFNGTDFTTVFVGTVGNMDNAGNDAKVVTQAAVKAYVTKQLADANIPTDSAINEKINTAKEEAITEAVSQAGTAADQKDAALKTQLEQTMDTKIAAQVASVFRFKGSKANKGEIDAIEGMVTGDVWHSENDGKEYVYDGEAWELLGFTVDLSAYATTAAVTEAINAKATELTSAIATAKDEAIAAAKAETTSQVNAHAGDKTIHITGEERTAWNAKAETSYVDSAKQAAITAAASDATTKANQALTDAKAYTDQKNSAMDTRMKAVEAAVTWGEIA